MRRRRKIKIKKLQYPLWFQIVFYVLTILAPLVIIMIEGYSSDDYWFRWTFGVISGLVLLWSLIHKFILSNYEKRMRDHKVALEHDYEIDVGNPRKIKWLWYTNEQWLTVIQLVQIILWSVLIIVFALGIKAAAVKINYLAIILGILYAIAYIIKFILISRLKGEDEEVEGVTNESGT